MNMRFFVLLCLLAIFAPTTYAADTKVISKYLQSLDSVVMDFVQTDTRGGFAEGTLILSKPYKFRCNYYAPYPLLLLGNKSEVVIYDYELEQTTRVCAKENVFNFLLADSTDWEKNFGLRDVISMESGTLYKLYHFPTERMISIILKNKPVELMHITIDEPDGNIIDVAISDVRQVTNISSDLFVLPNPDVFGIPKRLDKKSIEKKYTY